MLQQSPSINLGRCETLLSTPVLGIYLIQSCFIALFNCPEPISLGTMTVATMKLKPVNGFENELKRNLK